jgi:hypothetical protein
MLMGKCRKDWQAADYLLPLFGGSVSTARRGMLAHSKRVELKTTETQPTFWNMTAMTGVSNPSMPKLRPTAL